MLINQKGFTNVAVIIALIVIVGLGVLYVTYTNKTPRGNISLPEKSSNTQVHNIEQSPISLTDEQTDFETVSEGNYSGHDDKKEYVIKDISQWKTLWSLVNSRAIPQSDLPNINFDDEMVIAVFQGSHSTGGYSIEIVEILEKANSLEVTVKETSPSPGSIVTQAFTQPYHIIKTKKVDKEVLFRY